MIIRTVTSADRFSWERMRHALWPGDPHAEEIAAFFAGTLEEPEAVLVAEFSAGQPVAVIELSIRHDLPETDGEPTGYVEGLYVEPGCRDAGLALALLRAAQDWARRRDCTRFASDRDERVVVDSHYRASQ